MGKFLVRTLVAAPLALMGFTIAVSGGTEGPAGAAGAPYLVAAGSCYEHYSAQFPTTFELGVSLSVYSLPASANGATGLFTNTVYYVYSASTSLSAAMGYPPNQVLVSNGQGSIVYFGTPSGPVDVAVFYKSPGTNSPYGAGYAQLGPVQVNVPQASQCGSSNATSTSSVPGTNTGAVVGMASTSDGLGYWLVGSDGRVYAYGDASNFYDQDTGTDVFTLNKPIVGIAATPDGNGYWLVASDGGIFSFGAAQFYGSTGGMSLNQPIVGMAATPSGKGYWLVAADGGIFAYGDAQFYGSTGGTHLNQPIVGMAADGATGGYWLVAADGGVFAYNAPFLGSTGSIHLNKPIVGMEAAPDGSGYRFVASDGGIFCYGLPFAGSMGGTPLNQPVTAMAPSGSSGYWLGARDGGIFSFDASFHGSPA